MKKALVLFAFVAAFSLNAALAQTAPSTAAKPATKEQVAPAATNTATASADNEHKCCAGKSGKACCKDMKAGTADAKATCSKDSKACAGNKSCCKGMAKNNDTKSDAETPKQ